MRALSFAALAVFFSTLVGCNPVLVPAYDPVGSHTLKVGAEQDADVVWVQKLNVEQKRSQLFRCHNSPQGPQCVEAKTP
jgi:hypothetical protein